MTRTPLTREQLISVIEGRSEAPRIPMLINWWVLTPDEFGSQKETLLELVNSYPMDAQLITLMMPGWGPRVVDPAYTWFPFNEQFKKLDLTAIALDEIVPVPSWDLLGMILQDFPDPYHPAMVHFNKPPDGRYRLGYWWYWLFERHWSWRGMRNAMMDYFDYPDQVHRMFRAITDFYKIALERVKYEMGLDGIMISDDLGHQTGTFFSRKIFGTFFRPYYEELIGKAHALGLHIWLHSCGCVEAFLPSFVEMGLDVLHPIQKHAMDQGQIAKQYGSQICFYAGMDMQQILPYGTPEEVREEVRYLIDTFNRPEGRLLLAAGNAIHADSPLENIQAFLDEAYNYGTTAMKANGR